MHEADDWQHTHVFADPHQGRAERRTHWVIALTAVTMVVELVAGTLTGSMALLADGWHMATHVGALAITAFAYYAARRHAGDPTFTFGTGKIASLGGYTSAVALALVALLLAVESVGRLLEPETVHFREAMMVAWVGLGRPGGEPPERVAARSRRRGSRPPSPWPSPPRPQPARRLPARGGGCPYLRPRHEDVLGRLGTRLRGADGANHVRPLRIIARDESEPRAGWQEGAAVGAYTWIPRSIWEGGMPVYVGLEVYLRDPGAGGRGDWQFAREVIELIHGCGGAGRPI